MLWFKTPKSKLDAFSTAEWETRSKPAYVVWISKDKEHTPHPFAMRLSPLFGLVHASEKLTIAQAMRRCSEHKAKLAQ